MPTIVRSTFIISVSIFFSRLLGLVRDIVIATFFGAGPLTDAFFVAFRLPNILRRIFAEGAFSSAFTPAFSKKLCDSREKARRFARRFLGILLLSLAITVLAGEIFAPAIISFMAPGFENKYLSLSTALAREMFPYIFLVSLVAFYGSILNSFEHFFAPAFSTVLFNASIILSAFTLKDYISIHSLAAGVIAGGILQVFLQMVFITKYSFWVSPTVGIDDDVKSALKNVIPGIFGFGVRQISMLIDTFLASFLPHGAISYLYYANRFVQLPLGIFAVGISQVLLPRLSRQYREKELYSSDLIAGIKLCILVVIPSSVGLIFFGKPIVDLIFHHGKFTAEDIEKTYLVLVAYSLGLLFFSAEKILTNAFYSLGNYRFPVKVAAITLIFNLIIDVILCFPAGLGVYGLALGTSLTSAVNVFLLVKRLSTVVYNMHKVLKPLLLSVLLSLPVVLISIVGLQFYYKYCNAFLRIVIVILTVTVAVTVYVAISAAVKDFRDVIKVNK